MSQKNGTLNFIIRDANGQPQMVKVVKGSGNQPVSQIKLDKQNPVKIIKLVSSSTSENSNKPAPVFQTLKFGGISCASKLVQVPVGQISRLPQVQTQVQPITPKIEPVDYTDTEKSPEQLELEVPAVASSSPPYPVSPVTVTSGNSLYSKPPARAAVMSHATRRRHDADDAPPAYTSKRRKHADRVGKGLRHFSMKVCEKVRAKVLTTYNEVADELVLEFQSGLHGSGTTDSQRFDQKNIRRRVYDALNVLMAMNIISKEKKEIRWLGLPTNSAQECDTLEKEKEARLEQIQKKTQQLHELILQHISFKSLIDRNKDAENKGVKPSPSSAIHLPFIVVNTSDKAIIDCSISNDKTEYMFNFSKRFQIHDDIDILKRMGLLFGLDKGECSEEDIERAKSMVPKSLEPYVEHMGRGVIDKLTSLLEEAEEVNEEDIHVPHPMDGDAEADDDDEAEDEDADEDAEAEAEGGAAYTDDESDVDV